MDLDQNELIFLKERLNKYEKDIDNLIIILRTTLKYISVENKKGLFAGKYGKITQNFNNKADTIVNDKDEQLRIDACYSLIRMFDSFAGYIKDSGKFGSLKTTIDSLNYNMRHNDNFGKTEIIDKYLNESQDSVIFCSKILQIISSTLNDIRKCKEDIKELEKKISVRRTRSYGSDVEKVSDDNITIGTSDRKSVDLDDKDNNIEKKEITETKKKKELDSKEIINKINNYEYITEEEYEFITKNNPHYSEVQHLYSYKNYLKMIEYKKTVNTEVKGDDIKVLLDAADTLITLATADLLNKTLYDKDNVFSYHPFSLDEYLSDYDKIYSSYMKNYERFDESKKNHINLLIENNYKDLYLKVLGVNEINDYSPKNLNPDRLIRTINKNVKKGMLGDDFKNIIEPDDKSTAIDRISKATRLMSDDEIVSIYAEARKIAEDNSTRGLYYSEMGEERIQALYDRLARIQDEFSTVIARRIEKENGKDLSPEEFEDLKIKICKEMFWEKAKFTPHYSFNPNDLDIKNPALKNYDLKSPVHEETKEKTNEEKKKEDPYKDFNYGALYLSEYISKSESISRKYKLLYAEIEKIKSGESTLSSEELSKFKEDIKKEVEKLKRISALKSIAYDKQSEYEMLSKGQQASVYRTYNIVYSIIRYLSDNKIKVGNRVIDLFEASEEDINNAIEEVSNIDYGFRR